MTTEPINVSVSRTIAAPAADLFALISDVTRMPEWSPETTAVKWLGDAAAPAVGARFAGTNTLGKNTWTTKPTVTLLEPDRTFAFEVPGKSGPVWRYDLIDRGGRTEVTESVVQSRRSPALIRFFQRRAGVTDRAENLRQNMTTTLERIAVAAEQPTPAH